MDILRLQMAAAMLEAAYLPPLASVIATNQERLKDPSEFSLVVRALIFEALAKLDKIITSQQPPIEPEERRNFILAGSASIVKDFNAALEPDYPNILGILLVKDESGKFNLTISTFTRKELPGMHDCLRSEIIPVVTGEYIDGDNPETKTFLITNFKIYPELKDDNNPTFDETPDETSDPDPNPPS